MTDRQPDIEIYLKRASLEDTLGWLGKHFDVLKTKSSSEKHEVSLSGDSGQLDCMIFEKVAKGGYVSVWFKQNLTPWDTDEECARDAFGELGLETRCSVGGWVPEETGASTEEATEAPSDGDRGGWYRFTAAGQTVVNWLT